MRPESEERERGKPPTIKTTAPHWLRMDSLVERGKQASKQTRLCVCARVCVWEREGERERPLTCSRCCTHARQAHLIDRSVFVTSVNMLLYFDFKLSHCPFTSFFLLIKKFFSFFCTYSHFFALSLLLPSLSCSPLSLTLSFSFSFIFFFSLNTREARLPHFTTFYDCFCLCCCSSVDSTADSFSGLYILEWNC